MSMLGMKKGRQVSADAPARIGARGRYTQDIEKGHVPMWKTRSGVRATAMLCVLIAAALVALGAAQARSIKSLQTKERFHCNQARIYANKASYEKPRAWGFLRNYRNYCRTPKEQRSPTCRQWYRQGMYAAKQRRRFSRLAGSHRRACTKYRNAIRQTRRRSAAIGEELRRRGYHRADASRIAAQAMRHAITRRNRRNVRQQRPQAEQRRPQGVRQGGRRNIPGSTRYQRAIRQGMY